MKKDNRIHTAIDERLCTVHFDARDQRAVLRAVRGSASHPIRSTAKEPRRPFALAMAMALLLLVPLSLITLRLSTLRLSTAPGVDLIVPVSSPSVTAHTRDEFSYDGSETGQAIRIARACFESVCDTGVFTFDEYTVQASCVERSNDAREYTVTMTSVYDNGCVFSVVVAMPDGEVVRHSTPSLATVPTYLNPNTPQIAAWYRQYGPHLLTWPQETQAEFSRRYEGAMLRTAKEGELTAEQAVLLAKEKILTHLPAQDVDALHGYCVLYSERAGKDGAARYVVSVFPGMIDSVMPEALGSVSFRPDGSDVIVILH